MKTTMEAEPLRIGVVGCGKVADAHVDQVATMADLARVVAVCDREILMAEQLAVRFGIPGRYSDLETMIASERLDVVHVATPPRAHLALAEQALNAGCHVFVEKPLAPTYAECERLVDHARERGRKVTVGHTYLFDPPALCMRALIDEGVLGDPVHVVSEYGYNLDGPFGRAVLADPEHWVHRLPGGLMHNVLDHVLNKLVEFVDDDTPTVLAVGKRLRESRFGDRRDVIADELRVMIDGKRVTACAVVSSHARPVLHRCRIYGTANTMLVDYSARTVTLERSAPIPTAIGRMMTPFLQAADLVREGANNTLRFARSDFHFFAGLRTLLERFYVSIRTDGPAPISDHDMLWTARVTHEVIRQVEPREPGNLSAHERHRLGSPREDVVGART